MSATDFVVTDSATETNTTTDALSNNSTEGRSSTAVEVETAAAAEEYVSSLYRMPTGILVLCAFLAIGALVFATVSWIGIRVYRKTPIVAMAQPGMSIVRSTSSMIWGWCAGDCASYFLP